MEEGCFSYVVPSNKSHKIVAESNDTISLAHFSAVWSGFGRNNSLLVNCISPGASLKLGLE